MPFIAAIIFIILFKVGMENAPGLTSGFFIFCLGLAIYVSLRSATRTQAALKETKEFFYQKLEFHSVTLAKKFGQSKYVDDYGKPVFDKWFVERDYFIDNVLAMERPGIFTTLDRAWAAKEIDERASGLYFANAGDIDVDVENLNPIEFEAHCAATLRRFGWDANVTKASGDQGVDIVATYQGLRAVFQCKKYSTPVGNSAVQEIIAGRVFEQAAIAAVVTNSSFTVAARQLADSADVHLLHHSDLAAFTQKLGLT